MSIVTTLHPLVPGYPLPGLAVQWTQIVGAPTYFPTSWELIANKPAFDGSGAIVSVSWADVTAKPATFPPDSHGHAIDDIAGLQAALAAAGGVGSVDWTSITGKPAAFPTSWAQVSGVPATFAPAAHSHAIADIAGLQAALGAGGGGVVTWASIPDKPATFPPAAHTHTIADTAGLQAAIDAAAQPTAWADILGKPAVFPAAPPAEVDLGTVSGTVTLSADAPYKRRCTVSAATAFSLATPSAGAAPTLRLRWINGAATPAITWPAGMRWVTGTQPTFATAQGAENVVVFDYGSSGWIADGGPL